MSISNSSSVDQYRANETVLSKDKDEDKMCNVRMKKSILVTKKDSVKRGSSKVTIHLEEGAVSYRGDHKRSGDSNKMVLNRGLKVKSIHEVINRLRKDEEEKPIELLETDTAMDFPAREMGVRKSRVGNVLLSADQEAKVLQLRRKAQRENERYMRQHPELNIMLTMIYRMLFKMKPKCPEMYKGPLDFLKTELTSSDPKVFVADYVHHLNLHRDELVLAEVDVPFDQPADRVKDEEKWRITQFARVLVEKCAVIAAQGEAHVNVTGILDAMLREVSPSVTSMSEGREAATDILTTVLASVDDTKRQETQQIAEEIVHAILNQLRPMQRKGSSVDVRDSVERAVGSFMHALVGRVAKKIRMKDEHITSSSYDSEDMLEEFMTLLPSKSILRRKQLDSRENTYEDLTEESAARVKKASRVKFGTVDETLT